MIVLDRNQKATGFPDGSVVKKPPANAEDASSVSGQEDPLEEGIATHSSLLAWRITGQRNLVGYSPRSCK